MSESQQGAEICDVISRKRYWFVINPWKDDAEVMNIWKKFMKIIYMNWGPRKSIPFPFPSREVTDTKIVWLFFRDQISCPLNWGVPSERFHRGKKPILKNVGFLHLRYFKWLEPYKLALCLRADVSISFAALGKRTFPPRGGDTPIWNRRGCSSSRLGV